MTEIKSPVKAIRAKCLDCCCGQANEVRLCPAQDCPLWPFRFGKNPFRTKRELSEDQRAAAAARLRALATVRNREKNANTTKEG